MEKNHDAIDLDKQIPLKETMSQIANGYNALIDYLIPEEDEADSYSFVDRIYALAEKRGVPIGELEAAGGVSKGYLSRLKKNNNPENTIGAKALLAMAEKLWVPIEYFFQEDYEKLTPKEITVVDFIQKLRSETLSGKREWIRDDINWLKTIHGAPCDVMNVNQWDGHPLYSWVDDDETYAYNSRFYHISPLRPIGSFFHTELINQHSDVYVTMVHKHGTAETEPPIFELYIIPKSTEKDAYPEPQGICNSELARSIFANLLKDLYIAAEDASSHININSEAVDIMSSFLTEL